MKIRSITLGLLVGTLLVGACQDSAGPNRETIRFDPPSTEFVARLGITPPVNADQAKAIAAEAAGGTALSVSQETEGGEVLFEVLVDTPDGRVEVEVRASDGAVVEIEPDDGD